MARGDQRARASRHEASRIRTLFRPASVDAALFGILAIPSAASAAWRFEDNGPYRIRYEWAGPAGASISRFPVKPTGFTWAHRRPEARVVDTYPEVRSAIQLPFNKPTAF